MSLIVGDRTHALADAGYGVYETEIPATAGEDYAFVLDGAELPDPCSRWQPHGLRGRSRLLDARQLPGAGDRFTAPAPEQLLIYELHVGTFSASRDVHGRDRAPRRPRAARRHRDRADAGGGVPGRPRLGL